MIGNLILLIVAFALAMGFSALVYYVIHPLLNWLYYTYEPIMFHYVFKFTMRKKRAVEKVRKSYGKVTSFLTFVWHKIRKTIYTILER